MKPLAIIIAVVSVVIGLWSHSAAAGLIFLGYGEAAIILLRGHSTRQKVQRSQRVSLEILANAAAVLRAGLPPAPLTLPDRPLNDLAHAAKWVSDRTGASLATLFDRIETQQRALSRVDSSAHAQAAGIRVTVLLLFLLPLGALIIGASIGADPLAILLHTGLGHLCAATGFSLQLAGLAWANRIANPVARQPHAQLAFAADLIAAALRAGAPVPQAVLATARALHGDLSQQLLRVGFSLSWGVEPPSAWSQIAYSPKDPDPPERALVLTATRSSNSGASLAGALTRCADELRADAAHARQATVQRAGVLLVLPLGLCFLPAFVISGLTPVVMSVLAQVL